MADYFGQGSDATPKGSRAGNTEVNGHAGALQTHDADDDMIG